MSQGRISYARFKPGLDSMSALDRAVRAAGLESALLELVKVRASQINGCAYSSICTGGRGSTRDESGVGLSAWPRGPILQSASGGLDLTEC